MLSILAALESLTTSTETSHLADWKSKKMFHGGTCFFLAVRSHSFISCFNDQKKYDDATRTLPLKTCLQLKKNTKGKIEKNTRHEPKNVCLKLTCFQSPKLHQSSLRVCATHHTGWCSFRNKIWQRGALTSCKSETTTIAFELLMSQQDCPLNTWKWILIWQWMIP